mmetsp:Transcript_114561/g.370353  ORF Transcript_114561/g.370353 Transcript_114561/m.370353 type:complete len:337 (-) Transcript_114561:317-1327(-)
MYDLSNAHIAVLHLTSDRMGHSDRNKSVVERDDRAIQPDLLVDVGKIFQVRLRQHGHEDFGLVPINAGNPHADNLPVFENLAPIFNDTCLNAGHAQQELNLMALDDTTHPCEVVVGAEDTGIEPHLVLGKLLKLPEVNHCDRRSGLLIGRRQHPHRHLLADLYPIKSVPSASTSHQSRRQNACAAVSEVDNSISLLYGRDVDEQLLPGHEGLLLGINHRVLERHQVSRRCQVSHHLRILLCHNLFLHQRRDCVVRSRRRYSRFVSSILHLSPPQLWSTIVLVAVLLERHQRRAICQFTIDLGVLPLPIGELLAANLDRAAGGPGSRGDIDRVSSAT